MIKLPLKALFIGFVLYLAPGALAQDDPGLEDLSGIPVMDGLTEDLSHRVVFDKVEGRIIRTLLVGNVAPDQAVSFYREVLFQLGWIEESAGDELIYTRDEEHLTLTFSDTEPLEVTVSLRPLS
jgi:hypothetical protein